METVDSPILIRGGGDLATGVAVRLHRCGFHPIITELEQPLAVRREVSFAEAVYRGSIEVEGIRAELAHSVGELPAMIERGFVPVLVDPEASIRAKIPCMAMVDARMRKRPSEESRGEMFVVGLGPGFQAGKDCDAVVETNRGYALGRVIWHGSAEADTGVPETVSGYALDRVLRAPCKGELSQGAAIGTILNEGDCVICIGEEDLASPFTGVLRGLLHDGITVEAGDKLGDLDPRMVPEYAFQVSDKALAVAGGVLEALFSQHEFRARWADANASA
jgi:xanthine dehydrogenase accessory factor